MQVGMNCSFLKHKSKTLKASGDAYNASQSFHPITVENSPGSMTSVTAVLKDHRLSIIYQSISIYLSKKYCKMKMLHLCQLFFTYILYCKFLELGNHISFIFVFCLA